jgi:hypothetical protein
MIPHTLVLKPGRDLGAAGLREAWDAGDYAPFHGWDKRTGEMPSPR